MEENYAQDVTIHNVYEVVDILRIHLPMANIVTIDKECFTVEYNQKQIKFVIIHKDFLLYILPHISYRHVNKLYLSHIIPYNSLIIELLIDKIKLEMVKLTLKEI